MKFIWLCSIIAIIMIINPIKTLQSLKPKKQKRNLLERKMKRGLSETYTFDFMENIYGGYDKNYGTVTIKTEDINSINLANGLYFTKVEGLINNSPLSSILLSDTVANRKFISWKSFPNVFTHTSNYLEKDRYETEFSLDKKTYKVYFLLKVSVAKADMDSYTDLLNNARNKYYNSLVKSKSDTRKAGIDYLAQKDNLVVVNKPVEEKQKKIDEINNENKKLQSEVSALSANVPVIQSKIDGLSKDLHTAKTSRDEIMGKIKANSDVIKSKKDSITALQMEADQEAAKMKKKLEDDLKEIKQKYDEENSKITTATKFLETNKFILKANEELQKKSKPTFEENIAKI